MGTGTLVDKVNGRATDATWWNDIHNVLRNDFVGRDSSNAPIAGNNLGTSLYPWGKVYTTDIVLNGSAVGSGISAILNAIPFKIDSGKTRTTSNQPAFLTPAGAAGGRSLTIKASVTPLVYEINGVTTTLSSDIAVSGLTAAPASNNTCTVNESAAADQDATRTWGEAQDSHNVLQVTSMGSSITALVGKRAAFKIAGDTTEYFTAFVESSTTLTDCFRGFFFDSSLLPFKRTPFNNSATITLMKMGWLFLDTDGATTEVTYNEPVYSGTQPGSPASGDYWYDLTNNLWKRYSGSVFVSQNRLLIGSFFSNTADTLGVRCVDFFKVYAKTNTLSVIDSASSVTVLSAEGVGGKISVAGNLHQFLWKKPSWDITTDLAASVDLYNATEHNSRIYYAYVKDTGVLVFSDIEPYSRLDLLGWYHPYNPWRAVGYILNGSGSDFEPTSVASYGEDTFLKRANYAISASSSSFDTTSAAYDTVANLSVVIRTKGRPVFITLIPDGAGAEDVNPAHVGPTNSAKPQYTAIVRDGVIIAQFFQLGVITPPGVISFLDFVEAGRYNYIVKITALEAGQHAQCYYSKLVAYEI